MNETEFADLQIDLDRMARKQIADGLVNSNMTDEQQLAYAYLWFLGIDDPHFSTIRDIATQLHELPFSAEEKKHAIESWAQEDTDPIAHLLYNLCDHRDVEVESFEDNTIRFRFANGNWQTLDKLDEEMASYQRAAERAHANHPSLSADERNR